VRPKRCTLKSDTIEQGVIHSDESSGGSSSVTELLVAWSNGDQNALENLLPLIYDELHRLARNYMRREAPNHTLQTTALVHEAYLRLVKQKDANWQNRAHFFAASAQSMRHILVDMARGRNRQRRGGGTPHLFLDEAIMFSPERASELVALDDALTGLAKLDARRSRVVELRFFGGLSTQETAEVLKISEATVEREWRRAKAWLSCELSKPGD
jgi:RNA polymerase sigma factor (TIGR02999 family)